ncbi:piggyBac transposable element-derived protein 2-like [Calliphora vicina]|uniref:piggyBac transposable element-derived protein 2-like n=1 Tax=Calliphora vicina TaxID=7373 RepID=UPI00325BE5AE
MEFQAIKPSSFYGKAFKNLNSALDFVENYDHEHFDIAIIPPDPDYNTDEEEGNADDILFDRMPNDIPGEVEVFFGSDSEDDIPLEQLRQTMMSSKSNKIVPKWTRRPCDMEMHRTNTFSENELNMIAKLDGKSSVEVFEVLFDEKVVNLIVEQTCIYASQANEHNFFFNADDLKVFIGILLYSGYHSMPREDMYWQLCEDTHTPLVSQNMSRNRFREIKRFIHLSDNTKLDATDKMAKVRPLSKLLSKNFCQYGYMHEKLSVDESMVRYFGSHSSKQFIRGKPVRFGFKNWMLTSSSGYLYQFDTYCGAKGFIIIMDLCN